MPTLHSSREKHASEFARSDRRQCTIKEDPNMAAFPGSGTCQDCGYVQLPAGFKISQRVVLPSLLIEVRREKPARFVWQQWIYTNGFLAQKMIFDDSVGEGEVLPCLLVDFLSILRTAPIDGRPVLYGGWRVSMPAIGILPTPCIHVFSSAKQTAKQRDPLSGSLVFVHRHGRLS